MEWVSKAEIKKAKVDANKEKYARARIKSVSVCDDIDRITNMAMAVMYKLQDCIPSYTDRMEWLKLNCNIKDVYISRLKVGQRVLIVKKYIEQYN